MIAKLGPYESTYIDSIKYREKAAKLQVELAQNELEAVGLMKQNLLSHVLNTHNASQETHNVEIDIENKTVKIEERTPAPIKVEAGTDEK